MKDLWTASVGKHTVRIARLVRDKASKQSSLVTRPAVRVYGAALYDIQYQTSKQQKSDVCEAVARWASESDISTVGGPILSGAVLAEAISAHSDKLLSFYIAKKPGYYKPYKHPAEKVKGTIRGNYIIVDDIICSGNSMEIALWNVRSNNGGNLEGLQAVLSFSGEFSVSVKTHPLLVKLTEEGKMFGLYCSRRRRS